MRMSLLMKFKKFKVAIMGWCFRSLSYKKVVRASRKTKRLRIRLMKSCKGKTTNSEGSASSRKAP